MKIFETAKIQLYKKALDVHTKEHEAIAKNIANANNTNYIKVKNNFSDELTMPVNQKLRTSDERHITRGKDVPSPSLNDDGRNKVDVNEEMAALAVSQIRFEFAAEALKKSYRGLNTAISGRIGG